MKLVVFLSILITNFSSIANARSIRENFICGIFDNRTDSLIQTVVVDLNGYDSYIKRSITATSHFFVRTENENVSFGFNERYKLSRTTISKSMIKKMSPSDDPIRVQLYNLSEEEEVEHFYAKCYNTKNSEFAPFEK